MPGDQSVHGPWALALRASHTPRRPQLTGNAFCQLTRARLQAAKIQCPETNPYTDHKPRRTDARRPIRTSATDAGSQNASHSSKAAAHRKRLCQLTRVRLQAAKNQCSEAAKNQCPETDPYTDRRRWLSEPLTLLKGHSSPEMPLSACPCSPPSRGEPMLGGREEPLSGGQPRHRPQTLASRASHAPRGPQLTGNAFCQLTRARLQAAKIQCSEAAKNQCPETSPYTDHRR